MSDGSVVIEISLDDTKADKQLDTFEKDLAKAGTNAGAALDKAYREAVSDIASQSKRLKDTFVNAFKSMGNAGSNALKASLSFMRELPANVGSALSKLASTVKTGFVNAAKASITAVKNLGTSIKNTAVNIKNGFFSIAKTVQSSIVSAVKTSINVIKSIPGAIKSAGSSIKSALVSSLHAAKTAAISFAQTTVKVIKSIPGAAKTAATAVKNSFVVAYKAVVVAAYMSVKGTISAVKAIPSATKSAALAVSSAMKTAFSAVVSAAKTTGTTVKTALTNGFSAIKSGAKTAGQVGISALKGLGNAAKSTGSLIKNGLVSGFNAAKSAAKGAGAGMREALKNSVEKPAEQARFSILRLAAAFGLIAATKNVVGSAIGRVDTIDTATKSLTVLTGSAKDAQLVMTDLTAAIDGTPIALDAVALGAKKMVAAGMQAANVKPVFTAIADAAYGVGNGSESIDQMTDAISALQASGVAYSDDINRLVDAGVPAWQILANSTGKSVGEMKKYVSEGSLESTKAIAMLTKGIEEGTTGMAGNTAKMAGLAKTAGNTISGSFANMKTAAVKSLANIAENLKGPIIQALDVAKNAFKQFASVTASPEFQKKLSDMIQKIKELIPVLIELAPILAKVAAGFIAFNIISSVYSKIAGLVGAIKGLASSGSLLGSIINTVRGSFLALKVALGSATAAFGVIAAVIGAVIAVLYGMYAAFKENTANIKGFLSGMFDAVKNSFGKIVDVFKQIVSALKPVGSGFKDILKYVGVGVWVAFGIVLATVVDIIQVLARIVLVAIKALQGLYYALKAANQAAHWDLKGAKKSIEQSKDAFVDAGSAIKDAFNKDNYALTGTIESLKEMGGEAEKTGTKAETSNKKISSSLKLVESTAKQTEATVSKSNQAIDTMLSGGVDQYGNKLNEKTKSFLNAAKELYSNYQESAQKSQDKYTAAMEKAQSLEGEKRKKVIADANATLVAEIDKNNGTLLTLQADYAKLLKGNKWVDGTELTAQQKKFLQQQTADIQAELAKQNQLYVEGNLLKLANGKTLNEKERATSIEVQKSLYGDRKKAVETGEKELADLKRKKSDATTETEKANYQIQIDEQTKKNKTLAGNLQKWASEMNAIIANGGTLNAETFAKGLSEMGNISDEQLGAVWQDFVKVSGSIDNTLAGLAAVMSQRGGEGVQAFVTALQIGDYTTAALKINDDVLNTISGLPNSMFLNGQSGKDQFLLAIKSGDFQGAGKFLLDGVKMGADPLPGEMEKNGKKSGDAQAKGVKSTAEANKSAGKEIKNNAKSGAFDPNLFKMTGSKNSSGFNNGILGGKDGAFSAGTSVGGSAKSGAAWLILVELVLISRQVLRTELEAGREL